MLRAALVLATLLLLAAAAGRAGLRSPALIQGAGEWAQRAEERLAAWRHRAFATADGGPDGRLLRTQRDGRDGEAVLQVTLHLPNQQTLDIAEDATLDELVQKLLAGQSGQVPTSIEVVAVHRITRQRTSPWGAALLAALSRPSAAEASRGLPASTDGSSSSEERSEQLLDAPASSTAGPQLPAGLAIDDGSVGDSRGSASSGGSTHGAAGDALLGLDAFAEAGSAGAASFAGAGSAGAGASTILGEGEGDERLPMTAFDDAYASVDEQQAGRRRLRQRAAGGGERDGELGQGQPAGEKLWPAVKLFGPRRLAVHPLPTVRQEQQRLEEMEEEEEEAASVVVVRVIVRRQADPSAQQQQQEEEEQEVPLDAADSRALLLNRLALAAVEARQQRAVGTGGAALLGRRAAAGDGWGSFLASLDSQQQQQFQQHQGQEAAAAAPVNGALLALVDAIFVAAALAAAACAALLAVDIRRHGWSREQQPGADEAFITATAACCYSPVVVAADETHA